ncbi:MAG: hypothetical protein K0R61_1157 [Microvirga sp.]|jgi:hypothetical protein|nr:hypothetical protein [Microvirga sp.]MDF2970707.1 hypothetical protein [Microvirga sp.]
MPDPLLVSASAPAREFTYNLFRNRQRPELLCAVPEHRPVPSFLAPKDWMFERPLHVAEPEPAGFDDRAATVGVRFNGFDLFQITASPSKIAA